jgi:hypothetical protein
MQGATGTQISGITSLSADALESRPQAHLGYTIPPMPRASIHAEDLLTQLEAAKSQFSPGHAALVAKLLDALSKFDFTDPHQLIRFHECLLFLRAFPHARSHISRVERQLNTFHLRIERVQSHNSDMSVFDDFDTSGIAGTTMQDTPSFDVAHWLVQRIPANVKIAWQDYWDDYESERARGNTWPRFIPLLEEDADVEANIPWQRWLNAARGRENALRWLLRRVVQLPLPPRQRSELYDSLRIPIRWNLRNLKLSRTRNWSRPRTWYFHDTPLLQRSQVSLAVEIAKPAPKFQKLSSSAGESIIRFIREIMVVRYRELYGTTLGDPRTVVRADLGRGVVMHFWGLPPSRRLPLRAYLAGFTLKNGVPINYIEAIGLFEWIEVGFNTFYTYRQGETAWVYAQALRCLRALTDATTISIYPYQIGENNDEAIDSGAFWFYRKLGFRSARADLRRLCEKEERKIAVNPGYRTSRAILKRLAEAHMFYELESANPGAWEEFSVRNLGLRINRRMAEQFGGDAAKLRPSSVAAVSQALGIDDSRWTPEQRQSLENWSLVLAMLPDLLRHSKPNHPSRNGPGKDWSEKDKSDLMKIIRSKAVPNEMHYLRLTQKHSRLRSELLRLGSAK